MVATLVMVAEVALFRVTGKINIQPCFHKFIIVCHRKYDSDFEIV